MKTMLLSTVLLSTILSCNKLDAPQQFIVGNWGLIMTELFEGNNLKGELRAETDITTYYQFSPWDELNSNGSVKIDDEGESEVLSYEFNPEALELKIGELATYKIEELSEQTLVLSRKYNDYLSRYRFIKVD